MAVAVPEQAMEPSLFTVNVTPLSVCEEAVEASRFFPVRVTLTLSKPETGQMFSYGVNACAVSPLAKTML